MEADGIWVELVKRPVNPEPIEAWIEDPAHGAAIVFSGKVRNHNLGRTVEGVSYDAFEPLAVRTLREICREAHSRREERGALRIAVVHRLGRLQVGEISVVVAVSSPHRSEAYEASRYIIEELKERVPIWKKEHYIDGDSDWLQGHALCGQARHDHRQSA